MTIKIKNNPKAIPLSRGPDPDLVKPGCSVFVKWTNGETYRGIIREKLRKNFSVEITDDTWHYAHNLASVPAYALTPDRYPQVKIINHLKDAMTEREYIVNNETKTIQ
tara:strand:+ start:811 stop:1134 length:324 start_codon:yes stop_codon:yes gene_type:complete